ncbi:hypothetical protein ACFS7Z_13790 [Pontibacter toksunensis]|uniref:Uncharacterized protein n=1 Tax=Pontibacter toksunensis TaxID=1332631 RepID=A0ABW6BUK2_9BACT
MRNSLFTIGQTYLMSALGINGATQNVQFNNGDYYLRSKITAGGILELIDSNTKKVDGLSSFDGRSLEDGVNLALEKVRFAYGTSATVGGATDPVAIKYSTAYADVPAALANADLVISQHGKQILSVPVQRFLLGAASNRPAGLEDAYELDAIRLIKEKTELSIAIRFPKGATLPDANHFIELHLIGSTTGRKS